MLGSIPVKISTVFPTRNNSVVCYISKDIIHVVFHESIQKVAASGHVGFAVNKVEMNGLFSSNTSCFPCQSHSINCSRFITHAITHRYNIDTDVVK
jgi:hypothetical protein